jgi:hypothetical protein
VNEASAPCCFTSRAHPEIGCESRRWLTYPMCEFHTKATLRHVILDGGLPPDVFQELVQYTDWSISLKMRSSALDAHQISQRSLDAARIKRQAENKARAIVYYMKLTGERIKIGWTGDLEKRLHVFRLQASDVLGVEPGGQPVEYIRHQQFAHLRIGRTEDFHIKADLMDHIQSLPKAG